MVSSRKKTFLFLLSSFPVLFAATHQTDYTATGLDTWKRLQSHLHLIYFTLVNSTLLSDT